MIPGQALGLPKINRQQQLSVVDSVKQTRWGGCGRGVDACLSVATWCVGHFLLLKMQPGAATLHALPAIRGSAGFFCDVTNASILSMGLRAAHGELV
jgi:hypothetical protein